MVDTGTLIKKDSIPVSVGAPTERETKRWVDVQVPYDNWAGKSELFDNEVLGFIKVLRSSFTQRMLSIYRRWIVNHYTANGNSPSAEFEDDVHVPEIYKMLEAIKPRVEEAMFEYDPWLEVEGVKTEMDQFKALVVGSYIRRTLEMAGYRDLVAPTVQDSLLCQIAAIKVGWKQRLEDIIEPSVELLFRDDGTPYYKVERRYVENRLVDEGIELMQVDPFRLIIDLDAGQVKDVAFIGDESDQPLRELQKKADLGLLSKKAVEALKAPQTIREREETYEPGDLARYSRSITAFWGQREHTDNDRTLERVRTLELHTWYNFKDGYPGINGPTGKRLTGTHKVVITAVDDHLLQCRLNPYDKKYFPYGVARLNGNGHEMMAVGPFDNAVITNGQYDRYHSNVLRQHELAIAPIVTTGSDTDLPDTILGVRAGSVFRNVGDVNLIKAPDLPPSVQYMHNYYRREIEECTGAPRFWGGTGEGGETATETERKLQEANRRLRGYIRSYSDMWRQVALIAYWMSAQFATQRQRFKVVGKASKQLGKYAQMTPDLMMEDIDLRFIGLDNLHTYGQRGTGMVQWMNQWGPLLPTMANVNTEELAEKTWQHMVGKDTVHSIFNAPTPQYMLMSQNDENLHLRRGQRVPVDPDDDDAAHLQSMEEHGLADLGFDPDTPEYVSDAIVDHYAQHAQNLEKKRIQREAERKQAEQQQAAIEDQAGSTPGIGAPAAPGGLAAQQGITAGPTQDRTVARTGRNGAGVSQQQQMEQRQ
jgi:hypothetical protein